MIYSNPRKKALSGWFFKHSNEIGGKRLRLQKFLFFYEMFSKLENDAPDFHRLRGYVNGPVFSPVLGDYNNEPSMFVNESIRTYEDHDFTIDIDRAKLSAFLVNIMNENELSDFTHSFNIWAAKQYEIEIQGIMQQDLYESDISSEDLEKLNTLKKMYPLELINEYSILEYPNKRFLISREEQEFLKEEHSEVLVNLDLNETLHNPVFLEIDEEGVLLVD